MDDVKNSKGESGLMFALAAVRLFNGTPARERQPWICVDTEAKMAMVSRCRKYFLLTSIEPLCDGLPLTIVVNQTPSLIDG